MEIAIRILQQGEGRVLANVLPGVFDKPLDDALVAEFLSDPRHHLAVAVEGNVVVGSASAVHYIHPDKQPELWIHEVGVAASHRNRGIAKKMLCALFDLGRTLGCHEAWVLTDRSNNAAMALYGSLDGKTSEQVMVTFFL